MKRRSFLQAVGGAIAAVFVPAVAARQTAPAVPGYLTDPDAWHLITKPDGGKIIWVDGFNVFHEGKDGTFERPYLTCQKALDSCRDGDTIFVKSGHSEQIYGVVSLKHNDVKIIGLGPDRTRFIWPTPS